MANNTVFDDVFRTLLEKMPHLVIPLINEVFGTDYPDDIPIVQKRNEHLTATGIIITDSHLFIADKIYHIECQSTSDSAMVIRMIQYDFATALEYAEKENGKYRIYFPQSCVLYLRGKNGPDFLEMELVMPDGQCVNYKVPVIRAERYTSDMIFQKKLLFLLPFYIIRYEKSVKKIEEDDAAFQALIAEYGEIGKKLETEFLAEGKEREYRDLIGLIDRILDYVFKKSSRARKGIGDIMGGQVLELESEKFDRLLRDGLEKARIEGRMEGRMEGRIEGRMEGRMEGQKEGRMEGRIEGLMEGRKEEQIAGMIAVATRMLQIGNYEIEEISKISGLSMEQVLEVKKEKNL